MTKFYIFILLLTISLFVISTKGQQSGSNEYSYCENNCNGGGICFNGTCYCYYNFTGQYCNETVTQSPSQTPSSPYSTGYSTGGYTSYSSTTGYPSTTYSSTTGYQCPNNCNYNGYCDWGTCVCYNGWLGNACQYPSSGRVSCEYTATGVSVTSSFGINCTISGSGRCYDYRTGSSCASVGYYYYSTTQCSVVGFYGGYYFNEATISCTGDHIECVSEYATCTVNRNGQFYVNGIQQTENFIELTPDHELVNPQSSASTTICSFLLIAMTIIVLLL